MSEARNISVTDSPRNPIEESSVELVERKGYGHPDTLADGIAESISKSLSRFYREKFGRILHHNTDQVEIVGGKVNVDFGGGEVINPIHVILSGRATTEASGKELPVHEIAMKSAKEFVASKLDAVSMDNNFVWDSRIGHGSMDLTNLYESDSVKANDTSFGVGYAPFSDTESLVLEVSKHLNSEDFKKRFPELGEDIKVMADRHKDTINLTVAGAFIAERVPDFDHYVSVKEEIIEELRDFASKETEREVDICMNTADDYENEIVYLTLTGTSAEAGDDGSVGRGNRTNGLITPCRPMSLEAPAGKNPLAHVGKVYNVLARFIADDIAEKTEVQEVSVKLLSQIGKPIDEPKVIDVEAIKPGDLSDVRYETEKIVSDWLKNIDKVTEEILRDNLYVY
ncbi:MAG: methionine adenosyltransferase [Candidatus Aenigmatarchaeota archaeon]